MNDNKSDRSRGQAFTLEAFFASILILSAVIFALSSTVITPLSSSTSNKEIQNTEGTAVEGLLQASKADGSMERKILNWNSPEKCWYNENSSLCVGYSNKTNVTGKFGDRVERQFGEQTAVNVDLLFRDQDGDTRTQRLVNQGTPSENAMAAQTSIVLYDQDRIHFDKDGDGRLEPAGKELVNLVGGGFFAPDASEDTRLYNVITIRVIVWRI